MNMTKETFRSEMKKNVQYAKFQIKDLRPVEIRREGLFDGVISAMKAAQTKEQLLSAYSRYIQMCKIYKFYISDNAIIAAILSNEDKNTQFGITEDEFIDAYYDLVSNESHIQMATIVPAKQEQVEVPEPKKAKKAELQNNSNQFKQQNSNNAPANKNNTRDIALVDAKVKVIKDLESTIQNGDGNILSNVFAACKDANSTICAIDPKRLSSQEIEYLNTQTAYITDVENKAKARVEDIKKNGLKQKSAAHTLGGFNVNNFEKNTVPPLAGPATRPIPPSVKAVQSVAQSPVVNGAGTIPTNNGHAHHHRLPHEECGLTDDQIVKEVCKHVKLLPGYNAPAYALYDLIKSPELKQKMKQYGSKQRPNDPFLTQIELDAISLPDEDKDAYTKYSMAFTTPCKDKNHIIVVYYNPVPIIDACGCQTYNINILKSKLVK